MISLPSFNALLFYAYLPQAYILQVRKTCDLFNNVSLGIFIIPKVYHLFTIAYIIK